jgi:hypothetical protein
MLSIVFYDAFVRLTFVGAILNGKRKPRYLFKRKQVLKPGKSLETKDNRRLTE